MPSVAEIAKKAFDAVDRKMAGVIQAASVSRETQDGVYDPATGTYSGGTTEGPWTCRVLFGTGTALQDTFPNYVAGPSDVVAYVEGIEEAPRENDTLTVTGKPAAIIKQVGDVLETSQFYVVVISQ